MQFLDCVSNQPYIVVLCIYYEFKCMDIESNLRSFERSELERKKHFKILDPEIATSAQTCPDFRIWN